MADYISELNGQQMDAALKDMAMHDSEAWAVGTRNGVAVNSNDECYQDNSKYWASRASVFNTNAQAAAARAEGAIQPGDVSAVLFDRAQSLTDSQKKQARTNIGVNSVISNPNLLVNPYFVSSVVVNQRSFSSASSVGYTVDMWYKGNIYGTVALVASGLTVTGDSTNYSILSQYIPDAAFSRLGAKTLTASVQYANGTVESFSFTLPSPWPTTQTSLGSANLTNCIVDIIWRTTGVLDFRIRTNPNVTVTYRAAKLELGDTSTLANDIRINRSEEWEKCRFYFRRLFRLSSGSSITRLGIVQNATTAVFPNITDGEIMNGTPSVSFSGTANVWYGDGSTSAITALSIVSNGGGEYYLNATSSGLTRGNACVLFLGSAAYIDLDSQPTI